MDDSVGGEIPPWATEMVNGFEGSGGAPAVSTMASVWRSRHHRHVFDDVERAEHRRAVHEPRSARHVFELRDRCILVERLRHREQAPLKLCRLDVAQSAHHAR